MQSTTTLATTSFASPIAVGDTQINLSSTSGIVPGVFLYANRELMRVERLTGIGNYAVVRRGLAGTPTGLHQTTDTVWVGRGDQFYEEDPKGQPVNAPYVAPYINVRTGGVWYVQGDDVVDGGPQTTRTWQLVTSAQTIGPLGVRVDTVTTPS